MKQLWMLLLVVPMVLAQPSEEAIAIASQIQEAEAALILMQQQGFPIIRYNDTLLIAKQSYQAQLALEERGDPSDFYIVNQKLEELKDLSKLAAETSDKLKALKQQIELTSSINLTSVNELYQKAEEAYKSERYEEADDLIAQAHKRIEELESLDTKLKAFYAATSANFISFIKQRWQWILLTIAIMGIIGYPSYKAASIYIIKQKIQHLHQRKDTIKDLIAKSQKEYFEGGQLSESTYKTRIKKYAELLRDINRQIPLLNEELEMKRGGSDEIKKV